MEHAACNRGIPCEKDVDCAPWPSMVQMSRLDDVIFSKKKSKEKLRVLLIGGISCIDVISSLLYLHIGPAWNIVAG